MVANADQSSFELFDFGNTADSNKKIPNPRFHHKSPEERLTWEFMTPSQQRKAVRDANRSKVTYDMPEELITLISGLAEDQRVPASQLAALLMQKGLRELEDGIFDLNNYKVRTQSPRFEWVLILDPFEK
jgi:hypothetical protein